MHLRSTLPFCFFTAILLAACSPAVVQPQINFIGIGTGTLASDVNKIHFSQTFKPKDRQLVAVVSFAKVQKGTTVQATWFAPDEREIPLGRTQIVTQSGAHIARFSFASKDAWKVSPYELRIDASAGQGKDMKTASGTLSFFIGMKDADIRSYIQSYAAWQKAEAEQNKVIDAKQKAEQALANNAQAMLATKSADIVLQSDFTGRGKTEYLIVGTDSADALPPGGGTPGVLYAGTVKQFVVMDGSGQMLLIAGNKVQGKRSIRTSTAILFDALPMTGDLQVAVLPSKILSITWMDTQKKTCSLEIAAGTDHQLTGGKPVCQ